MITPGEQCSHDSEFFTASAKPLQILKGRNSKQTGREHKENRRFRLSNSERINLAFQTKLSIYLQAELL